MSATQRPSGENEDCQPKASPRCDRRSPTFKNSPGGVPYPICVAITPPTSDHETGNIQRRELNGKSVFSVPPSADWESKLPSIYVVDHDANAMAPPSGRHTGQPAAAA